MTIGLLHGGPQNGERIDMPWARLEIILPRWNGPFIESATEDKYRLRPPYRGQEYVHYDYIKEA